MYLGTVYNPENRKVLAHQLSSVRDGRFVSNILLEALNQHPKPAYLHSDMGSEWLEFRGIFTDIIMNAFTHTNQARRCKKMSNLLTYEHMLITIKKPFRVNITLEGFTYLLFIISFFRFFG